MARTDERGGPLTRARIREVANGLFVERGFEGVTVAEIARQAGVSSVTVFKHFPRKEDLFLDRAPEAAEVLRAAVRDRAPGEDALASLRRHALALVDERHPLSGVDERSAPFFRTVATSPTLVARSREVAAELQQLLAEELRANPSGGADPLLFPAFFIAGYTAVLVATARRVVEGAPVGAVVDDHRALLEALFDTLRRGFA